MTFIMLRYAPSIHTLLSIFIINGCWIVSNAFSASIDVITWFCPFVYVMHLKILFIYRQEGRERERERNINVWLPPVHPLLGTWPATQACTLTGNWTVDPLVHGLAPNPLSHTNQGSLYSFLFFFLFAPLIGWVPLPSLWVYWSFLLCDVVCGSALLLNFLVQLLYFFRSVISVWYFLTFSILCCNFHFVHALLSWP